MGKKILIIAEHDGQNLKPMTLKLSVLASALGRHLSAPVSAIVTGEPVRETAQLVSTKTGLDVIGVEVPGLVNEDVCIVKQVLCRVIQSLKPAFVFIGHSVTGLELAAVLAVKMNAACIPGIESMCCEDERIAFTRSVYNGKLVSVVASKTETVVITVQPGSLDQEFPAAVKPGDIAYVSVPHQDQRIRFLGTQKKRAPNGALPKARVVVSAGRGIGKKENLEYIYQLAKLFPRSAIGGSRLVCDMGWLPHAHQVGVTGCTVTPELYVACGISGALQHVSGMRGAGFIVSINTDPGAAIFNVSDVCIVEDLTTFIPLIVSIYQKEANP